MTLYAQYGCGPHAPNGWINFDASPRLRAERFPLVGGVLRAAGKAQFQPNIRYGNIVVGLPLEPGSVTGLYSSHVLEHIDRESVVSALINSRKLLEPDGRFRVVIPDLEVLARNFLNDLAQGTPFASDRFMRFCCLGREKSARGLFGKVRSMLGHSDHLWMYDPAQFRAMLTAAGFSKIRECRFGDSEDQRFTEVEQEDRFFAEGMAALAFEARL